jgi:hypothetical protein
MQRTEPELERSAAEQLAKESCVVPERGADEQTTDCKADEG